MFKHVHSISDIRPMVAHKKEIRFYRHANGITTACYMFMDDETFDTPEALECRGIAFDDAGNVVSRPLHKFFNVGEKAWLAADNVAKRDDIHAIYEKLDGSMIATCWVNGALQFRSKQSFDSDVVKLTHKFLQDGANTHITAFCEDIAAGGMTAIFELTHPDARIIVAQEKPQLRLLHIRDNVTGAYLLLDAAHPVHEKVSRYGVPRVPRYEGMDVRDVLSSLEKMQEMEGYVIQFANGDMAKVKCPWYSRLHHIVSYLRERDIAALSLEGRLDDVKSALLEMQIDIQKVNAVEARLKKRLTGLLDDVERIYEEGKGLDRKDFAIKYKPHELFGPLMARYTGKQPDIADWYKRRYLREEFGLNSLADGALADALEEG